MTGNNDDAANNVPVEAADKPVAKAPSSLKTFLRAVTAEMKKTKWPTRDELTKSTIVVVSTMVFVALFLFVCDWASAHLMVAIGIVPPPTK